MRGDATIFLLWSRENSIVMLRPTDWPRALSNLPHTESFDMAFLFPGSGKAHFFIPQLGHYRLAAKLIHFNFLTPGKSLLRDSAEAPSLSA